MQEIVTSECDSDVVYHNSSAYLLKYEIEGENTEESYIEVLKDLPPSITFLEYEPAVDYEEYDLLGAVYDYIVDYLSREELVTGECASDVVYQDSCDYLRQHEIDPPHYRDYVAAY
jgi:hypothetical protein